MEGWVGWRSGAEGHGPRPPISQQLHAPRRRAAAMGCQSPVWQQRTLCCRAAAAQAQVVLAPAGACRGRGDGPLARGACPQGCMRRRGAHARASPARVVRRHCWGQWANQRAQLRKVKHHKYTKNEPLTHVPQVKLLHCRSRRRCSAARRALGPLRICAGAACCVGLVGCGKASKHMLHAGSPSQQRAGNQVPAGAGRHGTAPSPGHPKTTARQPHPAPHQPPTPPSPLVASVSKKPLLTVSSGQLSSRMMGVGGASRRAARKGGDKAGGRRVGGGVGQGGHIGLVGMHALQQAGTRGPACNTPCTQQA